MSKESNSKNRVMKHRRERKSKGFKSVSFQLSERDFRELKKFRESRELTYSEAIHELLINMKPKSRK
jgi:hypothetical protein